MPSIRELVESLNKPTPELPDVEDIGNTEELWIQKEDHRNNIEKINDKLPRSRRFRTTILDEDDAGEAVNADDIFSGEGISGISQKGNISSSDDDESEETMGQSEYAKKGFLNSDEDEIDSVLYSDSDNGDSGNDDDLVEQNTRQGKRSCEENSSNESDEAVDKIKVHEVMGLSNFQQQVNKGKSVQRQMDIFEKLMHLQIKAHSTLRAYNRLPRGAYAKKLLKLADEDTVKECKEAKKDVFKVLETLLVIEDKLLSSSKQTEFAIREISDCSNIISDEEIESSDDDDVVVNADKKDGEGFEREDAYDRLQEDVDGEEVSKELGLSVVRRKHRNIAQLDKELRRREDRFANFRTQILSKWDERIQLTAVEANAKRNGNFDSVILKQIRQVMSDKHRLIRRTQIKRSDRDRIGGDPEAICDPEIFDDDDFYQLILKDLIERKTANTNDPVEMSRQWIQIQQLRQKRSKKKVVDTKASKGRKIHYVVIPKLVNYFPSMPETVRWSHEMRNQLFQSLFTSPVL